jgi:hypothetical protein
MASIAGKNFNDASGHFGGDVFWRDPAHGEFGLQGSYISQGSFLSYEDGDSDFLRGGAFGNLYLNDRLTIGGDAHVFGTTHNVLAYDKFAGKSFNDFELSANAKYYATPDLRVMLKGDFLISKSDFASSGPDQININGYGINGQVDYQFNPNGLTGFIGARYVRRALTSGPEEVDIDDRQVYVGLTLPLGGNAGTLVQHDRTGPVDNTSTYLEKLPSILDTVILSNP